MNRMYNPAHTRFGPFAAGGLLACNVFLARQETPKPDKAAAGGASWAAQLLTAVAAANLVVPCLPAADEAPLGAQLFATAALRQLAAASAGLVLYRCLVPPGHAWASPLLRRALTPGPPLAAVARVAYPSYLVHFRLLEFLNFSAVPAAALGLPGVAGGSQAGPWEAYMLRLFAAGAFVSLVLATAVHLTVESPMFALF